MVFESKPLRPSSFSKFAFKHHFLAIGLPLFSTMGIAYFVILEVSKGKDEAKFYSSMYQDNHYKKEETERKLASRSAWPSEPNGTVKTKKMTLEDHLKASLEETQDDYQMIPMKKDDLFNKDT